MSQARGGNFAAIVMVKMRPTLGGSHPNSDPPQWGYSLWNGAGV